MKAVRPMLVVLLFASSAYGDAESIAPGGINSAGLQLPNGMPLDGAGMGIGQVEGTRPGKPGYRIAGRPARRVKASALATAHSVRPILTEQAGEMAALATSAKMPVAGCER